MSNKSSNSLIAENRKARFNYQIEDTIEAGIVLKGTEVKSCRAHKVNLQDSYCAFRGHELWMQNAHIAEYSHGNRFNHEAREPRKLLLKTKDLQRLLPLWQGGTTIVPLKMYFKGPYVKVLLGIGKGKKKHDKRESIKERDVKREIARTFRKA